MDETRAFTLNLEVNVANTHIFIQTKAFQRSKKKVADKPGTADNIDVVCTVNQQKTYCEM